MTEMMLPNLYRIEIPLPKNPLKALNSYLIKGDGRFLIIDTGMNREECQNAMFTALEELKVDLKKTDFFITHIHADHLGLVAKLATDKSRIYFNPIEAMMINDNSGIEDKLEKSAQSYLANGFPPDELKSSLEKHPGRHYGLGKHLDFYVLKEGDRLDIGDYSFRCIETPGHSPNHMCLYEPKMKLLISGDHILSDITPNISYWDVMENPLKQYLDSLSKVYPLEVSLALPGHRSKITDHKKRIRELRVHHQNRIKEAALAIENGARDAYQVAPYITWDIDCKSWDQFPAQQKWFAFGETLAHLIYMKKEGLIREKKENNKILFSPLCIRKYTS